MQAKWKEQTETTHAKHMNMLKMDKHSGSVLLLGDSMMERWQTTGKDLPLGNVFNAGVGGDRICNLLWRIENGILDAGDFSRVVLMIGTNDLEKTQPKALVDGISQVVGEIQKRKLPFTVYSLTPRTDIPEGKILQVNALLQEKYPSAYRCFYPKENPYYDDNVHLSRLGYEEWSKVLLN